MAGQHLIRNDLTGPDTPYVSAARGSWLYGEHGQRYLDAASGAVVLSIGHAHPRVLAAMTEQLQRVTFTHRGAFSSRDLDTLAEKLCGFTGYDAAWFVSSGSEAVEAAMQLALQHHAEKGDADRTWFASPKFGYHGNTLGGLSLSGHARRSVVRGLAHEFTTLPAPYRWRDARDLSEQEYSSRLVAQARQVFEADGARLAAVVVEPVGGATAGATMPPAGYLPGLRALCDEFGVLMIVDEVMTGLGRTGAPMAAEQLGVRPDMAAVGKGLGAGYQSVAAVLVRDHVVEPMRRGSGRILGGHTYGGNPLAAATGLAVLSVLEDEHVLERSRAASRRLEEMLTRLAAQHETIAEVRGIGMMWGLELVVPGAEPATAPTGLAKRFFQAALALGVAVYPTTGGVNDAVLVCPPLTITDDDLDALEVGLAGALRAVAAETVVA